MHLATLGDATEIVQTSGEMSSTEVKALKMVYDLAASRSGVLHTDHADHISLNDLFALCPRIAVKLHIEPLLNLVAQIDPNLSQVGMDDKAITFDTLRMLMQLNPQKSRDNYEAKTK